MIKKIKVEISKRGLSCLWEEGGGFTNTGRAIIIANGKGQSKKPIYVRRSGHLACSEHALIPVLVGDYIIQTSHHRYDFTVSVHRIEGFREEGGNRFADISLVNRFDQGEWDADLPDFLVEAVVAAKNKATCYHCRSPHFVRESGDDE
jgi:hypothetical protein